MTDFKDEAYLQHILENITLIEKEFADVDAESKFLNDMFFRFGVYYALQTMSESAWRLSDALKQSQPDIDWKKIWNFRNVMAHDYLGDIDANNILKIIKEHLPALKKAVLSMKGKI